jgi:conjugal transfer ATP-binding protein TraC
MTYEIPQQLQHKEKIMFGLTFGQLGWAGLWGGLALIILLGKASLNVKLSLAIVPVVLGILFVFFDLATWIKNTTRYIRFRETKLGTPRMQQLVPIKKIEKQGVLADEEVAIIRVTPINFGIKTSEEKESIIYGFQKFLNSLDFSVQFVVTTQPLSLQPYLDSLEKRTKNKELFEEFSEFTKKKTVQQLNKEFYIIIPKKSDLTIQCDVCQERLKSMGLYSERLRNKELLEHLKRYYNHSPREASENVDPLQYLLAPGSITDYVDYLKIDEELQRVIVAIGYPRAVESGFLDKIISSNDNYDISLFVEPFSIESTMVLLNQELMKQRADLYAEEQKRSINPSLEIKYRDTLKVLEALQKGDEKLFNVSMLISCKAKDKKELDLLTRKVESELHSLMIVPNTPMFRQSQAYKAMMPLGRDYLGVKRNVTTRALSAFFPFTSPFLTMEETGTMLGLNKNNVPYIKDLFKLSNANGVVLATSGAGKSYFTKLLISRQLMNDTGVTVIDPQAEYSGLVEACKGELVTISRTSKTIINPLDLMGHDYIEKRLALMDLFRIMFGELSEVQKSILDKAVNETYAKKGITADSYKNKKPPMLGDLYKTLMQMDRKAAQSEKITYRALINRLYLYTDGVFGFLNKQSNINYGQDFVCFNIGDMPKQVKPVVMFLILDYVYMTMKRRPGKKLLVVDEAWSLLSHAEEASYLFEIVKTCRKFNMGLLLITQDVADLVNSKAGHAVLANSSYSFLLRQKPAVIDSVVKTFHLSQAEKEYLLTATQGKGILILDNDHQELTVIASKKEHELVTTNPNEKPAEPTEDDRAEVEVKLDHEKGLFFGNDLTDDDKNYLINHGYKAGSFVPIGKVRQEECWVKANKVESLEHTFLVQNIKQHIQKYTQEIEVNIVSDADIVFRNKQGKKVAIEVETGTQIRKNRRQFAKKFNELKKPISSALHRPLRHQLQTTIPNSTRHHNIRAKGCADPTGQDIPECISCTQ